jgi:GT2 family glycosyltransferase
VEEVMLSVVIPAHNDAHHLDRLLSTLLRNQRRAGGAEVIEVIVVANGCVDGTVACCHRHGVRWLDRPPLNPAAARNAGVEVARGRWLAFLDADTDPGDAWLDGIRDLVERHNDGGQQQIAGWPVLAPAESGWVARAWQRVRFSPGRLPDTLDCANLVMTRALFDRLGGFNAGRIAGEDVEICEQAVAAGQTLLFEERLAVQHYGEPRNVRQFFIRELFHADPLARVFRNLRRSVVDLTIIVLLLTLVLGISGTAAAVLLGKPELLLLLVPALFVSTAAAMAKAAVKWTRSTGFLHFVEMSALCQVMLLARATGTVVRRSSWRSPPLDWALLSCTDAGASASARSINGTLRRDRAEALAKAGTPSAN